MTSLNIKFFKFDFPFQLAAWIDRIDLVKGLKKWPHPRFQGLATIEDQDRVLEVIFLMKEMKVPAT